MLSLKSDITESLCNGTVLLNRRKKPGPVCITKTGVKVTVAVEHVNMIWAKWFKDPATATPIASSPSLHFLFHSTEVIFQTFSSHSTPLW